MKRWILVVSDFLNFKGFNSIHTLELPDKNNTKDGQIAKLGNQENWVVFTKDIDFLEFFLIKSEPQKLIIVRTGNISNKDLVNIFR